MKQCFFNYKVSLLRLWGIAGEGGRFFTLVNRVLNDVVVEYKNGTKIAFRKFCTDLIANWYMFQSSGLLVKSSVDSIMFSSRSNYYYKLQVTSHRSNFALFGMA